MLHFRIDTSGSDRRHNSMVSQLECEQIIIPVFPTFPTPKHDTQDGEAPEISDSKVRFGTGSDTVYINPLASSTYRHPDRNLGTTEFGLGSVWVGDRSGHQKNGYAS